MWNDFDSLKMSVDGGLPFEQVICMCIYLNIVSCHIFNIVFLLPNILVSFFVLFLSSTDLS